MLQGNTLYCYSAVERRVPGGRGTKVYSVVELERGEGCATEGVFRRLGGWPIPQKGDGRLTCGKRRNLWSSDTPPFNEKCIQLDSPTEDAYNSTKK